MGVEAQAAVAWPKSQRKPVGTTATGPFVVEVVGITKRIKIERPGNYLTVCKQAE